MFINNFLKELVKLEYPCQMYNWDAEHPTNLPLDKALTVIEKGTLVGGADREGWLCTPHPMRYAERWIKSNPNSNPRN